MEGFDIPLGADFSAMQDAFDAVIAAVNTMGDRIVAALEKSSAAALHADSSMAKLQAGHTGAGNAASAAASKMVGVVSVMGNLGNAASGASSALHLVNSASRVMSGIGLAQRITGWVRGIGGLRSALTAIPRAMRAIASNRTFQLMAAGAVLAIGSVLAIRTAYRTVAGSVKLLGTAASAVFRGMVSAARKTASTISGAFNGIASAISIPALPIAGLLSLAGAVGFAFKSVGKAAEMESSEAAFAPLLGSAAAAKERIADLAQFSKDTPFELPEVAAASRVLQTLTKGALATSDGLRMVGDVAAGVKAPFEEISVTIGRLYDGLQSGRPVGEAMMRLQELGVISGNVRGKIEALQKEGKKGPEVWGVAAAALGVFEGSMARLSRTWTGKLSNLSDSIGLVMAAFGTPIIDGLKPFLDMAIGKIESMQAAGVAMGNAIRGALEIAMGAFQTDSITALLMNGLELAFISGINTFMAGLKSGMAFLSTALRGILGAVKDGLMNSGLVGVFNNLAAAMGSTISAAIMSSIGKVTGWAGWEKDAEKERGQASFSMGMFKQSLGDLDFLGGMETTVAGIQSSWEAAKNSFAKNKTAPFIDDSDSAQSYIETQSIIRAQIQKNRDAAAALNTAPDAKLKKPPVPESPMDSVSKAVTPAVMSLTRIGGGGFANTVMNSQLNEARKQTGYLKKISEQGSKTTTATAVYA